MPVFEISYYSDEGIILKQIVTSAEDLTAVIEQTLEIPSAMPPEDAAEVAISVKKVTA